MWQYDRANVGCHQIPKNEWYLKYKNIRRFQLKKVNTAGITDMLLTKLGEWNVDLNKWRGKGFHGASMMVGYISGVTMHTQQLPQAKYFTHCQNHCLNFVVVNSCKDIPEISNFMNVFRELFFFVNNSHKRKTILKSRIAQKHVDDTLWWPERTWRDSTTFKQKSRLTNPMWNQMAVLSGLTECTASEQWSSEDGSECHCWRLNKTVQVGY